MSKKLISVMLALVLVLSAFAVSAFAGVGVGHEEPNEDEVIENTQDWSLEAAEEADANGYYAVTVSLKTNYDAVSAISFVLNVEGATLVDYVCNIDANADIVADDVTPKDATGNVKTHLVNIYPMPDTTDDEAYDFTAGAAVATLYYELNGDSATITLNNDAKCIDNPDGKLFAVRSSNGKLAGSAIYGQRVVDAEGADIALEAEIASVTIGVAMLPAELALTELGTTNGVIIDTNKFKSQGYAGAIYGFAQPANTTFRNSKYLYSEDPSVTTDNLTATNGGKLVVKNSVGATSGATWGTGSTVEVINADGTSTGKIYVVVIFGDMDGNGFINPTDLKTCKAAASDATQAPNDSFIRLAGNCAIVNVANMMHTINPADLKALKGHTSGTAKMNFATLGAKHNSYNTRYQ